MWRLYELSVTQEEVALRWPVDLYRYVMGIYKMLFIITHFINYLRWQKHLLCTTDDWKLWRIFTCIFNWCVAVVSFVVLKHVKYNGSTGSIIQVVPEQNSQLGLCLAKMIEFMQKCIFFIYINEHHCFLFVCVMASCFDNRWIVSVTFFKRKKCFYF